MTDVDAELDALREARDSLRLQVLARSPYASRYVDSYERPCDHPCGSCASARTGRAVA